MIRAAALFFLLGAPALAGGPAWEDMIAEADFGAQYIGAVFACANAVSDPQTVAAGFAKAGWDSIPTEDGTVEFQSSAASVMFWAEPGFCMLDSTLLNTDAVTTFFAGFDLRPTGKDVDGCVQFALPDAGVVATLTGPGNDPVCTSATGSTLRFEVAT